MAAQKPRLAHVRLLFYEPLNELGGPMTSMLKAEGFSNTQHVFSLDAARAEILAGRGDAVILEADGNEMSVGQVIHDLRLGKLGDGPFLPVVVSQSDVTRESARLFSFAGADAVLDKPFSPASVKQHLEQLAARPRVFVVNGPYAGPEHRRERRNDRSVHLQVPNGLAALLRGDRPDRDGMNSAVREWRSMLKRRTAPAAH